MLKRWFGNIYNTTERNYQTFNKIQTKSSFGRHVGGQQYAFQHGGQWKYTTLLKNQSAIKYVPWISLLSNFGCKITFMCSVKFWHQQDSNSLFKGSIGHVAF